MAESKSRKKGSTKTGTQKKGIPNEISNDLLMRIAGFLGDNFDEAAQAWKDIAEPIQKVKLYTDLIKFAAPTLQPTESEADKPSYSLEDKMRELNREEHQVNR